MIAELGAGLSSLKAVMDIAKGLNAANTQAQINEVKIALQERIFDIQNALSAAQASESTSGQRIRDLEQEIMQLKDWEAEKQRYQLKAIDTGAFAYMMKPGMEGGEPPHWLCTVCFDRRQKSLLQSRGQVDSLGRGQYAKWACNACKGEVLTYYTRKPSEDWPPPSQVKT